MSYNDLRKGRHSSPGSEHFITTVVANRQKIFTDLSLAREFILLLRDLEKPLHCGWRAWVLMPDHFHGLLQLEGQTRLAHIMQTIKGKSARLINQRLERNGPLWQPGFYDHALRDDEDRISIARYIVANPLRAGLADAVGAYPHWDCEWL